MRQRTTKTGGEREEREEAARHLAEFVFNDSNFEAMLLGEDVVEQRRLARAWYMTICKLSTGHRCHSPRQRAVLTQEARQHCHGDLV